MGRYFVFASRPMVLGVTFVASVVLLVVFPALPVGGELLDVKQGYTTEEAMAALAAYGAEGRRLYAWSSVTLDTLLPIVYATFLVGVIVRFRPSERLWILAWLPICLGFLDLAENAQIVVMLVQFPDVSAGQVASASTFTTTKNLAFVACFALAAILAVIAAARFVLRRRRARAQ